MNFDDLTYGQLKEIANLFNTYHKREEPHPAIGHYCIVRCRDAGVHAGTVEAVLPGDIVLRDSRRMWRWKSDFTLSEAAVTGIDQSKSRIAKSVPIIYLRRSDVCEMIPCTGIAKDSIEGVPNGKK